MADIEIHRAHHLGLKGARAAADKMAEHLGTKFGLSGDWSGNTLHFQRPGVSGTLAITDRDVDLAVSLGFLLKAMKGSIERAVHEELDKLFAARAPTAKAAPAKDKPAAVKSKKGPARPKKGG